MKKIYGAALVILIIAVISWVYISNKQSAHSDEYYMGIALDLAKHHPQLPFSAIIINDQTGEVLAEGLNESTENPILHAEIVVINNAIKNHPATDWKHATLYSTAEPCPMCQGAIIWMGIHRVVFGSSTQYLKTHGWPVIDLAATDLNHKAAFYSGVIKGGVLANKTDTLFIK